MTRVTGPGRSLNVTTRVAGSQDVMVTVVTRWDALTAPGRVPGVGDVTGGTYRSTAASPAGFGRTLTTSKYDAVTVSPTLTWSKRATDCGTSRVTTFPCSPRILTVRVSWSTASTVPRRVISLRNTSGACALARVDERAKDTRAKSRRLLIFNTSMSPSTPSHRNGASEPTDVPLMAVGSLRSINCPGRLLIAQNSCQVTERRRTAHQKNESAISRDISI